MKRIFFIFTAAFLFFSCETEIVNKKGNTIVIANPDHVNDDERDITEKRCFIKDFDFGGVEINDVSAYFLDGKNFLPYVEMGEFSSGRIFGFFAPDINLNENTATYRSYDELGYPQKFILNWKENTLTMTSASLFKEVLITAHISNEQGPVEQIQPLPAYYGRGNELKFDFDDYGFDVLFYKGKVLVPFSIYASIFYRNYGYIIYNGADFCYTFNYDGLIGTDKKLLDGMETYFYGGNFGKECPEYLREASFNILRFEFENFYGMKNYRGANFLEEQLQKYKPAILNADPKIYTQGVYDFVHSFGDLHNSMRFPYSTFYDDEMVFDPNASEARKKYFKDLEEIKSVKYAGDKNYATYDLVRYSDEGRTAVINIDGFISGTSEERNSLDEPGADLDWHTNDVWTKSNYAAMRMALHEIESMGTTVENIVIDVSTSTGGELNCVATILGFMEKNPMFAVYDSLEDYAITYKWRIDVNNDGKFDDDEGGYFDGNGKTKYNWYVLTSNLSFSCAHILPLLVSFNGYGKIIGQKSGGGSCVIYSAVPLPDGLGFMRSSRFSPAGVKYVSNGNNVTFDYSNFTETENGIEPDIPIEAMNAVFYGDLANIIEAKINSATN